MSNNKDFVVKNAVEVGGATKVTVGDAATAGSRTAGPDLSVAAYDSVSFSVSAQETLPQGIHFKPDGTIMYIIGADTDRVKQYTLSTAWDLTTASYASKDFYVGSQDTVPQGMTMSYDGTELYVVAGSDPNRIIQYTLSTAWDISTASYTQRVDVSTQSPTPTDVHFKPDGTKMYIVESNGDDVEEYDLSTAWDISTATHNQTFSISSEETSPVGLTFNTSGTKMFVLGLNVDDVNEYTLSTAWDISTATFVTNFSVTTQENSPRGIAFKSDGTKMYIVGPTNDTIYQYSTGSTVTTGSFDLSTGNYFTDTPSADVEYTFSNAGDVQSFQLEVTGNSAGYDLSSAAYDSVSFSVTSQDTLPTSMKFNSDGTKMFVAGDGSNNINEYSLSTAYDVSTASYSQNFSTASQTSSPQGLFFKPDGTKMYISVSAGDVYQYALTTAFDLSTASYESKSFSTGSVVVNSVVFKPDGTKMFTLQATNDRVEQFSLSTAWDVSTASSDSTTFSVASQDVTPHGFLFNSNGTKAFMVGASNDTVYQYSLSTAYDLSSMSYDSVSFSIASQDTSPKDVVFNSNGTKMYIVGNGNDTIYQYSTSTAITVTWDADIAWPSGTAPDSPAAGEKDIYTFTTDDGGTTYIGVQSGDAFQ